MVKHDLRVGSVIQIGDAMVRLDHKSGRQVCLVIDAPDTVKIKRHENIAEGEANKVKTKLTFA